MPRPITLFTGQWADLPFEEVCRLASGWGYDGLEIACWGDHFDVWQAVEDDSLRPGRKRRPREVQPPGLGDLQPPQGPGRVRRPDRLAARGDPAGPDLGRRRPRRRPAARRRGDEETPPGPRAKLGVDTVVGFTGSSIWQYVAMFPPVPAGDDRGRLPGLRRPLEPDPRRLRRGGRPVRPRGAPLRDRLRLLDHRADPGGDRSPRGVRAELGPVATSCGRTSTRSPSSGTSRTGSTTSTARTPSCRSATAATAGWARTCPGRDPRRGWDFVSTGHGDVPWEDCFRDAQRDRLRRPDLGRVGGRRHGPPRSAPPRPSSSSGGSPSTRPRPPSTPPSRTDK